MTKLTGTSIFYRMLDVWQHSGSFVIRFSPTTNPPAHRFYGRAEHVGSGKMIRFSSLEELCSFMSGVLNEVRQNFEQADTLAEETYHRNKVED